VLDEGILQAVLAADLASMGREAYDEQCRLWAGRYGIKDWRMLIYWRPFSLDNDPCHIRALQQLATLRKSERWFSKRVWAWLEEQVPRPPEQHVIWSRDPDEQIIMERQARQARWEPFLLAQLGDQYLSIARREIMLREPKCRILFPQQVFPLAKNAPDCHCVAEFTQRAIKRPVRLEIRSMQDDPALLKTHAEVQLIIMKREPELSTTRHKETIGLGLPLQKAILRIQAGAVGEKAHVQLRNRKRQLTFDDDVPCTAGEWSEFKKFRG
jgi:hypothetical protein